jgi:glycosyltransferase involved in cell wall biosynthesis
VSRIAVVTSSPPLAAGGHLVIARSLVSALRDAGHEADLVLTPQNRFGRQASAYLATRMTDVVVADGGRRVDQVISFRYPSYAVKHSAHVCWLNHRMREYYDLWEWFSGNLSLLNRIKERVRRRAIHAVDRYLLTRNVTKLFAQSKTIQARLVRFGGIGSEVLYPPAPPRPYRCDAYGDYLFAVSRLTPLKRMDLLVRALAQPDAKGARAVIAGDGEQASDLRALVVELGLGDRVHFVGAIDESDLVDHLARCRAVWFGPYDEDYGFVTVEAFSAAKAVITCSDSGGPAELVHDGVEGLVCAPTPEALAGAIGAVMNDRGLSMRMGAAAARAAACITWPETVRRLLIV